MKVYVDFDRTLFDCDKFLVDFYALISNYNIPKDLFKECQSQSKRRGFNPDIILGLLEKKCSFNKDLYKDIDSLICRTSCYLFSDTISFLEKLKELNYQVVILTRGNSLYQREKIFNAHLDKYYDKLIVTMHHKGNLNIDYNNSIFIDDNIKEIESILKMNPYKMICITHGKEINLEENGNVFVVACLSEIIEKQLI